jgi:hypothetical protein
MFCATDTPEPMTPGECPPSSSMGQQSLAESPPPLGQQQQFVVGLPAFGSIQLRSFASFFGLKVKKFLQFLVFVGMGENVQNGIIISFSRV